MRTLLTLLISLVSPAVFADALTLHVPGEHWSLLLESPPLKTVKDDASGRAYQYWGTAGRLNVSLQSDNGQCPGTDTDSEWHKCMLDRVVNSPIVVSPSVEVTNTSLGQMVSYLGRVTVGGKTVESVNVNILFMKNEKECNLHMSMLLPLTEDDKAMFVTLVNSSRVVEK